MTKTVTIAATRTNGDPYAHHDVIVTLVAGSAGGVVGSNVVVESSTVKLDADGEGSIVLETNEAITSPATSFYRFTVADSSPTITRSVRLTDDLPSTVSWTLADIQVGDPTIPQRDVSSDYVTIGGQSLTNYLATVGDVFTVPMTGQWNANVDQVLSVLAEFVDITPTFPTPLADVDIVTASAVTGDVTVNDIPTNWTHAPVPPVPEAYIGFNLPTSAVAGAVGFDTPFWGRLRYVWPSGWTATVYIFYRDGIPADSTGAVRVVVISGGRVTEGTVPAAAIGVTGAPVDLAFTLSPEPPAALQWIVTADTVITGREDLIFLDAAAGTTLTVEGAEPPDGTKLTIVTNTNAGVFAVGGESIWDVVNDATVSTWDLTAYSVVVLARVDGVWAVLSDSSTGGGGGVALGETSTTAYRGDRGKTAYDHTSLTNNPHSVTAAQVGAASNAAVPFKAQVGDWVSEPHDGTFAATQTLNRLTYVPWLVPAGFAQTDGIAVEVTTVATSALCRLGIYLPHATTGRPGALVVDGGTVDFSSGGGAAGIRTLTITATNLTPGSLIYVAVVPQGATAAARHTNTGEVLRSYGYASSTVADVFRVNGASAYYEGSVTGALPANATPLIGNIVGQPVVALRRSA